MPSPRAAIVHCPALGREIWSLLDAVPSAEVYESPLMEDGYRGCTVGHQMIVNRAKAEKWPYVWVMEDDCTFTDAYHADQWQADLEWAQAHGYPILNGGSVSTKNPRKVRDGLFAVDKFKSTHCIVYFETAYDTVLNVGDGPIDKAIGKIDGRAVVTYPFVAIQKPCESGTLHRFMDYSESYRAQEARLSALR